MTFSDAVKTCLQKYCEFSGRARRSEYWFFVLFTALAGFVVGLIAQITGANFLTSLLSLGLFLPELGVAVRRLHDVGKSGWWLLISIIPVVGSIILLVWMCQDSQPGGNQYGPSSKY